MAIHINKQTKREFRVHGDTGRKLLKKYVQFPDGTVDSSHILPKNKTKLT